MTDFRKKSKEKVKNLKKKKGPENKSQMNKDGHFEIKKMEAKVSNWLLRGTSLTLKNIMLMHHFKINNIIN